MTGDKATKNPVPAASEVVDDLEDLLEEAYDHAGYDGRGDNPDSGRTDDR